MKPTNYKPEEPQKAFHYACNFYRFTVWIAGIRGGKTYGGAREAVKQAWNAKGRGVYGIVAPTYNMLDRTTWAEFKDAARPWMAEDNDSKKIITLKNGRKVHGHSAERPDRIRGETFVGFWGDEMREAKDFKALWEILLGRVLSTGGKGFITTSPNSYDDIHDIFIAKDHAGYGVVRSTTYDNRQLKKESIDELASNYDTRFAQQELMGEFVIFEGAVYYAFNRTKNAGDLAFKVAQYNPALPIRICADFNVDPMAWPLVQIAENPNGLAQVYVIDEIFLRNSNTVEACQEFKSRYPDHKAGLYLYGDATGQARHTSSNLSDWKIIENELVHYGLTKKVPTANPAERDRVNSVNSMICNSKDVRRVQINPKCKNVIRDLEQVSFKEGSSQIDKTRDRSLTHASDALGYLIEKEYSLTKSRFSSLKI
jgi:phage terminase large subunit